MALVTYDVSAQQRQVKDGMIALGYSDQWLANNLTYYLPNTTLWKESSDPGTAIADLKRVVISLGVRLERAVAVPHSPWSAIPGDPHSI